MTQATTELAIEAARRGGDAILAIKNQPRTVVSKGFRDDVTDADYAAQEAIIATIRAQYATQLIASEENDFSNMGQEWEPPQGYWWLIDPLDGTTNFSRGVPHYSVSVAVLKGRELVGGAVYDPSRDHLFAAERGGGAMLNGVPIHVSDRAEASDAIIEAGLARSPDMRRRGLAIHNTLAMECRSVRTLGSAALALAYVAAGWLEGYVHLTLRPWDSAAGGLMVQEAGGLLTLPDGSEWRARYAPVLATNGRVHSAVVDMVGRALSDFS